MKRNSKLIIDVPSDAKGKILFVSFNLSNNESCSIGDMAISINGNINKKTCSEWKYYKFTKENETIIRFTDSVIYFENQGYSYEVLKPRRYNDETFKKIVKEVLADSDIPLGTTDLWHRCLNKELLLTRETFLKRLRKLNDKDICLSVIGSSYTWSIK